MLRNERAGSLETPPAPGNLHHPRSSKPQLMCRRLRGDSGMVTLETALMVPVLVFITFACVSIIGLGLQTLSLSDATRTAARELARGTESDQVSAAFQQREPEASIMINWTPDSVSVHTVKRGRFFIGLLGQNPFTLEQTHVAPREDQSS